MAEFEPLAGVADLAARVGETLEDDDATALYYLKAASALIRSETGRTWVDSNGVTLDVPSDVKYICVEAAARLWRNPDGAIQETVGPFTSRLPDKFADGLFLTVSEKAQLARYRNARPALWTLPTYRDDPFLDTLYLPVDGTTEQMPYRDA